VTIVAITHFMHEATLADRVIVLENGIIALQGTPREVFGQVERLRELQLDVPEISELAHRLHREREMFPENLLTVHELVEAVTQAQPSL
jgi:ABC-type multidrug transport system ATPase subunit